MDKKSLIKNFKNFLILAVGEKPSISEMKKIEKHIICIYKNLDSNNNLEIKKAYNLELAKLWPKIVANENNPAEILKFIKEIKFNKKSNLLSIASGLGIFEMFLAKYFLSNGKVYCADFSTEMNKKGKEIAKKLRINNIKFILTSVTRIPLKNNSQNFVIARRTGLSYSSHWKRVLKEARRILNKDPSSRFIYTVEASLLGSSKKVKKELKEAKLEFISSHTFKESDGTRIAMIVAK